MLKEKESEIDNLRNAYEDVKTQLKSYKDLSQVEVRFFFFFALVLSES